MRSHAATSAEGSSRKAGRWIDCHRRSPIRRLPTPLRPAAAFLLLAAGFVSQVPAAAPVSAAEPRLRVPIDPDRQGAPVLLGAGASPDLAIDAARRVAHLVYRTGPQLHYRAGDLAGRFGPAELVFTSPSPPPALWSPRIVVDRAGTPHVAVDDGHLQNATVWYFRRRDARWSAPLVVFDKTADRLDRATMPDLAIAPDGATAYVGAFTVGGPAKEEGNEWGILARLEDLATAPRVVLKNRILAWNPQPALVDGRLWVGGRNIRTPDRQFALQEFDPATLAPLGAPLPLSGRRHGEVGRMAADERGDLHAAGTLNNAATPAVAGWYQSLSRARSGRPAVTFLTTNRNARGAVRPVPDRRAADRVYLVHWHGADLTDKDPKTGIAGNFLHYVRVESGEKAVEGRKISPLTAPHGNSYRQTPAAAAHPDGGLAVIVQESAAPDRLHFVTIGTPSP